MTTATPNETWIYDPQHGVYYHVPSNTYAIPDPQTGQWSSLPAQSFQSAGPSTHTVPPAEPLKEDGELDDDVGWGGLMDPDKLEAVIKSKPKVAPSSTIAEKHPAYQVYRAREPTPPPKATPSHILRLVVSQSEVMPVGGVAVVDAREGGIQLGRDRCEKGGQARVRVKEMEVSKTQAVVYWGLAANEIGKEEEGWWVVDLGSTHGTFVTPPSANDSEPASPKRLSQSKYSSRPHPLTHLCTLTLGATSLIAHIHPSWPCETCKLHGDNEIHHDDGLPPPNPKPAVPEETSDSTKWAMDSKEKRENRERKRKREMAMLRETLLNRGSSGQDGNDQEEEKEKEERKYIDRSAIRRKLHPPSPPLASANSRGPSVTPPPPPVSGGPVEPVQSSFAMSIMANQGWTPGSGLGRNGDGRADPVSVELRTEKRGLGANGSKAVVDVAEGDWRVRGKQRRWEEMEKA